MPPPSFQLFILILPFLAIGIYTLASPNRGYNARWADRVTACMIDFLAMMIACSIIVLFTHLIGSPFDPTQAGWITVIYLLLFELSPLRRTPGKMAMRIKIATANGEDATMVSILKRRGIMFLPTVFLPTELVVLIPGHLHLMAIIAILGFLDLISPLWHPENRAWHDILSGTRMINQRYKNQESSPSPDVVA